MKQYVIGAALLAALSLTACTDHSQDTQHVAVVAPQHHTPSHPIQTIDTDRAASDVADVNYVTGGIGDDERAAIESEKANYNVHITSSAANGAFVEDTNIVITSKTGGELLNITAGPLTYVQLPAGSYTITASHANDQKTQKLVIGKKAKGAHIHFAWKVPSNISE